VTCRTSPFLVQKKKFGIRQRFRCPILSSSDQQTAPAWNHGTNRAKLRGCRGNYEGNRRLDDFQGVEIHDKVQNQPKKQVKSQLNNKGDLFTSRPSVQTNAVFGRVKLNRVVGRKVRMVEFSKGFSKADFLKWFFLTDFG
jgi:hypothetical protein